MVFAPEVRGDEPLTQVEIGLVQWVVDHEVELANVILLAIAAEYPRFRFENDFDGELPEVVNGPDEMRPLLALRSINVHQVLAGDAPYVGFHFDCPWEEEHGAGVLLQGTEGVEVKDCYVAEMLEYAERDAELRFGEYRRT